ncbi:MAG: formylglycine-generating enzyme family protein [Acidobacteria bacterium]|nr:formylglycine-generating enzyme family protein [Acidobacteriota bacterium]
MTQSGPCPDCGHDAGRETGGAPALPPGTVVGGAFRTGLVVARGDLGFAYAALDLGSKQTVTLLEYYPHALASRGPDGVRVVPQHPAWFAHWMERFKAEHSPAGRVRRGAQPAVRWVEAGETVYTAVVAVGSTAAAVPANAAAALRVAATGSSPQSTPRPELPRVKPASTAKSGCGMAAAIFLLALVFVLVLIILASRPSKPVSTRPPASRPAAKTAPPKGGAEGAPETNTLGMTFVRLSPGRFVRGSSLGDPEERPLHGVTLTRPFALQTTEVTQAQWKVFMENNPSTFKGDDRPVENVSWEEAQEFVRRLNKADPGKGYRLPTEAEWEYACRAGRTSTRYGLPDTIAWHGGNAGGTTHPVGTRRPNRWGLYDMLGNVAEWCADGYGDYGTEPLEDPVGPAESETRVSRGGSILVEGRDLRASRRSHHTPRFRYPDLGFRLARD